MKLFSGLILIVFLLLPSFGFDKLILENPDKPLKGNWDFKIQKKWIVKKAGEENVIGNANQMVINREGTLYVHDIKQEKFLVYDKRGKFLISFGKKGEGPGEFKHFKHATIFNVGGKFVGVDLSNIHYFSSTGKLIKSIRNPFHNRTPQIFLNENEFLSAPWDLLDMGMGNKKANIYKINLKTNSEMKIATFDIFKGGYANDGKDQVKVITIIGLSPIMIMGYYNNRIYYGMNDKYLINVCDLKGRFINTFSIKGRKQRNISSENKKKIFEGHNWDPNMLKQVLKNLPDKLTFYSSIKIHNGLIYVYESTVDDEKSTSMDIFSIDGRYLYRADITPGDNLKIKSSRNSFVIRDGYLYISLEDENHETMVGKYKITLPKS